MGKDSREIRHEIEETRERMGETIEALGYKADVPARVKDNINERVETVKGVIGDAVANAKGALGGRVSSAKDALDDTKHAIGDGTADRVAGAKRAIGLAGENPLGLALGALAVGFLTGLLIPVSDLERKNLGPLRDKVIEQAKDMTSDLVDQGKAVISETTQAAVQSAQSHLSAAHADGGASALLEHGKAVVTETAQAAVKSAQSHISSAQGESDKVPTAKQSGGSTNASFGQDSLNDY